MKKNLAVVVIGIVIALMIIGIRWVRKRWVGDARYMPAVLFAAGGLSWSIASLFRGTSTLDLQLHDTYYVISGVMVDRWVAVFLFVVSGIYLLFSKAFAGGWINKISYVHFWVTFVGMISCLLLKKRFIMR